MGCMEFLDVNKQNLMHGVYWAENYGKKQLHLGAIL